MKNYPVFDEKTMMIDFTNIASLIPFSTIEKHAITHSRRECKGGFTRQNYDIKITPTTQSKGFGINVSFGNPIFMRYDYITFYPLRDILFFKLSNTYVDTQSYTITRNGRRNGIPVDTDFLCTKVAGEGYDKLKFFSGSYTMTKYPDLPFGYDTENEEIFFITKPYSII